MHFIIIFLLSFGIAALGILAPGMLNMTIARLSIEENKKNALLFTFGAVCIVLLQSFAGAYFAKFLDANPHISDNLKKFGTVIFILLTTFFIYNGIRAKKTKVEVDIKDKRNRFLYGIMLSSLNMFAIPYYAFVSLTLASQEAFHFSLLEILIFALGASSGTLTVFYLYAVLFKKIEHRVTFISNNINFLIAAITGFVALVSIYNMLNNG